MPGIQMTLDSHDIDRLRGLFGRHQDILEGEWRRAEVASLTVVRDEARKEARAFATDARLPNSITFETIRGGLQGIVGSLARTAPSIYEGRKPGDQPSSTLLANWVGRRGLAGETFSIKTHKRGRPSKAIRSAELALAWKIAIAIKERGAKTGPHHFILPAAAATAAQVQAIFKDATDRALRRLVHA